MAGRLPPNPADRDIKSPGSARRLAALLCGTFRVNTTRVNGANGDIDGDVLVYQQFRRRTSNLRFFDLVGRFTAARPALVAERAPRATSR